MGAVTVEALVGFDDPGGGVDDAVAALLSDASKMGWTLAPIRAHALSSSTTFSVRFCKKFVANAFESASDVGRGCKDFIRLYLSSSMTYSR